MEKDIYLNNLKKTLAINNVRTEDIEAAVKYADNLLTLGFPVIFDTSHFALLVGRENKEIDAMVNVTDSNYYHQVHIPKKSGGIRSLDIPAINLKLIQKWILNNILYNINVSKYANGFCKNRSIITNAKQHLHKECVINMDIKDFFPSISQKQIFRVFYYYGYTVELSYLFSKLCTYNGYLPQGAPTSPYLSNIVCLKLDKRLSGLAKKYNADYTRYADDITFSGKYGIQNIVSIAKTIIEDEGFIVNENKTRITYAYQKQEVTGLNVNNEFLSVDKKYLKKFKQELYYCKKYGVSDHLQHTNCTRRFYKEHMYGKAYFINMINKNLGKELFEQLEEIDWES